MLKTILKLTKKFIIGAFLLYAFNLIGASLGIVVPINTLTIIATTVLGFPGVIGLILLNIVAF